MNFVYKLIFNASTGTWAVAHELAAARGKKNRSRLAKAMAIALALPAGSAMAADSPSELQCDVGLSISLDGQRCEATKAEGTIAPRAGTGALALGSASADGMNAVAIGTGASAAAGEAVAQGFNAKSPGQAAVAIGAQSSSRGYRGVAVGTFARVTDDVNGGTAIGGESSALADGSVALGFQSSAYAKNTVSVGNASIKRSIVNVAAGTSETDAANVGQLNTKADKYAFAGGASENNAATVTGVNAIAIAVSAKGEGEASVAIGASSLASGYHSVALGTNATNAEGLISQVALGDRAETAADRATALGMTAKASASKSVALGAESVAQTANTVSVGNATLKRSIVNVAAGTAASDVATVGQLTPLIAGLGGGAAIDAKTGVVTGPTYKVDGKDKNLGQALASLNESTTTLKDKLTNSGVLAADGAAIAAVTYDRDAKGVTNYGSVTLGNGKGAVKLTNLAAGTNGSDAVNLDQLKTAVAGATPAENNYVAGKGGGTAAKATGFNSLALGINSVADEANTVSVGKEGATRRITNLAAAQGETDAATYGQVTALVGGATASAQRAFKEVDTRLSALTQRAARATIDDTYLKIDAPEGSDAAVVDENNSAVAIGASSSSIGSASAAIGAATSAKGSMAAAIGGGAIAEGSGALAMGSAQATASNAAALGNGARATAAFTLAAGANARAEGMNAVALGNSTRATADNAVAIGTLARVDVSATNSMAIGRNAAVAAKATNAMSLGNNSTNDRADTISVGSAKAERQIINVAAGTSDTDAVNLSQLKQLVAENGGSPLAVSYADDTKASVALEGEKGTKISNLAAGKVTSTSTDAINGAQLQANAASVAAALGGGSTVKADGTLAAPSYTVGGKKHESIGNALGAVDTSLTSLDGRTTELAGQIANSGLVDDKGNAIAAVTYDQNKDGTANYAAVTLGEAGTAVTLSNVAAGKVTSTSTDAINGAQLQANAASVAAALGGGSTVKADGTLAAPSYTVGEAKYGNVGGAIGAVNTSLSDLDGRAKTMAEQLAGMGMVDDEGNGLAAVTYDQKKDGTANYAAVTLGEAGTAVTLSNVAAGKVTSTSSDAINGAQLQANAASVAAALGGGSTVKVDGTVSAPSYIVDGKKYESIGNALGAVDTSLTSLDGRTTELAGQIANSGLVDDKGNAIAAVTYDQKKDGTANYAAVTLGEAGTAVTLSNVAAGKVTSTSTDAINGAQLQANAASVAAALGGGSTVKADGTLAAPSYTVGEAKYGNVGGAIGAVNTSLSDLDGRAKTMAEQLAGMGMVDDEGNGLAAVTYDQKKDGTANYAAVTLGEAGTAVTLSNVAAGKVTSTSTDAINGAQLQGAVSSVATALGGGSTVKADGTLSAPTYTVGDKKHDSVGGAIGAVNTSLTDLEGRTSALDGKLADTGLVDGKGNALAAVVYGQNTDGTTNYGSVTLGKAGGSDAVRLKNLAAGVDANDAVNMSQLTAATTNPWFSGKGGGTAAKAAGFGSVAIGINSVAAESNTVSVGSSELQRRITHVAAGQNDTDVATYGQLVSMVSGESETTKLALNEVKSRVSALGDLRPRGAVNDAFLKVDAPEGSEAAIVDENNSAVAVGASSKSIGSAAVALGAASSAKGSMAAAIGGGSIAEGSGALAMGQAKATAIDALALGNGALATASNALGAGSNARAEGTNAVALGNSTRGTADNAVAIGTLARVDVSATNSVAIGRNASVAASATNAMSLGSASTNNRANTISVGSVKGERQIVNVAAGTAETDAVNFGQLKKYVGDNAGSGGAANPLAVAYTDSDKGTVSLGGSDGTTLANVKAGTADTDAANVAQVKGVVGAIGGGAEVAADGTITAPTFSVGGKSYSNVGETFGAVDTSLSALDGRVTGNSNSVTSLTTKYEALSAGTSGIVTFDATSATVKVASAQAGTKVDFANSKNEARKLSNVAAGTDETDAVNFSQLKKYVGENGGSGGEANPLAVAYTDADKGTVSLGGAGGTTLANVKAGTADTDAANVAQVKGVANAIGGGAAVAADGTITAPSFNIGGKSYSTVGDTFGAVDTSLTDLDGRVTGNSTSVTNLTKQYEALSAGTSGLVTFDASSSTVKVASAQAGSKVDFANRDGQARTLANVAAGTADGDAVNVSQLKGTAESVANALGGGAVVNEDGTVSQPSYTVGGKTVNTFGDAITNIDERTTNIDNRTTTNEAELSSLGTTVSDLSNGTAGLVTLDKTTGNVQVAKAQGGTVVDMEGTDGKRRVSGVANGTEEDDVVTIAQLRAAGAIDPVSGQTLSVLTYDGADLSRATLGGTHGTVLANVANGIIGAGSMEAINGGQLFDMKNALQGKIDGLDGRVGTIEKGIADGSLATGSGGNGTGSGEGASGAEGGLVAPGAGEGAVAIGGGSAGGTGSISVGGGSSAGGNNSVSVGEGSSAGGTGSISVGEGSSASGTGSVAIGEGAKATHEGSVAIGSGSTTERDNEVSVGTAGTERVISNVAAGTHGTDAVNLQQMDDRFKAEHDWSNSRFQAVDKRIDRMGAISAAYAGMAINTAGLNGDNRLGAGVGSQNGRTALAVGYQRILGEKKNVSVSLGGAFSGSDQSVSAGAGISW